MSILRASPSFVTKIMVGKIPTVGFTIYGHQPTSQTDGQPTPVPSGYRETGSDFLLKLDPVALAYTPARTSPQKYWKAIDKPGTYMEIRVSDALPLVIVNGNFEANIPATPGGFFAQGVLTSLGWTIQASPVDAAFPPANNFHMA